MLSRVAERIYWLARYMERVEDTARLLLVQHNVSLDMPRAVQPGWELLLEVRGERESFDKLYSTASEDNVVSFVLGERGVESSLISSLTNARENMRTTREILPSEGWEQINSLYLSVARRSSGGLQRGSRHAVLNSVIKACQQHTGMLSGTMSHGAAYQFLRMGRMLERADMITRIIDVGAADLRNEDEDHLPYQNALWISVLQSLSAYQMYRLSVRTNVNPVDVIRFLLHDRDFPRALVHSLLELEASMQLLPAHGPALKVVRSVQRTLRSAGTKQARQKLEGEGLHVFLDKVQLELGTIHKAIDETWFSPGR